jgi:signal peptide peptidase-like protein 2B
VDRVACTTSFLDIGTVTILQMVASLVSYAIGATWLYMALTFLHPDENTFFWVMQDVFGACMCIMFLSTMRLNSIKVATTLLIAAFVYDIFFVFVTPYLTKGGKSIMVDVATSGGPPKADPSWCEKYPHDHDCRGGDPLPMLFTIPRLFDFTGGSSMLGLGDIVLPGLLISFAARYDEAKRFIGKSNRGGSDGSGTVNQTCSTKSKGYFPYLVIAYAVGLAMANIAVYVMNMGQPALLYLVPCCLGTMVYLAKNRGEDLWNTPKVIIACDEILYGIEDDGNDEDENDIRDDDAPGLRTIS